MKLEEIKQEILKASSMEITELVLNFKKASQFSNSSLYFILDKDKKRNIMLSDIQSALNFEIKSLIYESEIEDRLEKGIKAHNYSVELEYKNDDLKEEIQKLKEDKKETIDSTISYYKNELEQKDWKISSLELEIKELKQKIADMQKPNLQEGENN